MKKICTSILFILLLTSLTLADLSLGLRGGMNFGWFTKGKDKQCERSLNAGGSASFNVQHYLNNRLLISYFADYSVFKPTFNSVTIIMGDSVLRFDTKDIVKSQTVTLGINPTIFVLKDDPKVNLGLGIGVGALIRLKSEIYEYIDDNLEDQYEVPDKHLPKVNIPISMNYTIKVNVTEKLYITIDNILSWGTFKQEAHFNDMDFCMNYYSAERNECYYKCMLGLNLKL